MAEITNQFAHIFIHYYSNKTTSACRLFISEPTQTQENQLGRLFGILEINTPSRENTQLINHLISNLENTYYSNTENEVADITQCFESTLREVNNGFVEMIRNKQFSMVGNLNENTIREKINLAIGVMKDNKIYISYLNDINLLLVHKTKQDYKIIDIKKISQEENNNSDNQQENINLFSNLLSGEVNPHDYLILVNSSFMEYITPERIQKIITSLPLHKATEYFKNSLLKFEGQNFAAILIKNSVSETGSGKEPASLTSITELNSTESKTEKLLAPSIWNLIKNGKDKIIKYSSQIQQSISAKYSVTANQPRLFEPATTPSGNKQNNFLKVIQQKIIRQFKKFYYNNHFVNNLKNKLSLKKNIWRNKFNAVPSLSKILLVFAGILLILFVFSIFYFKQQQKQTITQKAYQDLISQIEVVTSQAESDLIYGDKEKAKTEIAEAQNLLATLPVESKMQKDASEKLNQAIWKLVAKLRQVTIVEEPTLIYDLNTENESSLDIGNIIDTNNTILAFNSQNNTNFQINLETRLAQKNISNLSDLGSITKVKKIDNKILAYHNKNGFVEYREGKYIPINIETVTNAHIADFVAYNSRLYTVDTVNNQIYRQPKTDNGYSLGVTWLKQAEDLKDIVAMSIDTSIWLLDKKGPIYKFTKGNKQAFEIKDLEPALESPTRLFTDDQTNYIYVLEPKNKRIVILDKSGKLAAQYYSDVFNNLQDFTINEKEKKIFVSNNNKIYTFNLSHLK
jgi:hypothetical protein